MSQFDEFVFFSMSDEPMKVLLEERFFSKYLVVQHTSSKKCQAGEVSAITDEATGQLRPLKVDWKSRGSLFNFLKFVYFVLRMYYVSVYFYFLPFLSIILSVVIPQFAT